MASLHGIDLNEPTNLVLYTRVIVFKYDTARSELTFSNKSSSEQRIIQAFAHNSGLEYEYSVARRLVTVCRSVLSQDSSTGNHGSTNLDLPDLASHWPIGSVATDNEFDSNFLESTAQNRSATPDNGQSSVDIEDIGTATRLPPYLTNGQPAMNKATSMDAFLDTFLDNFHAVSQNPGGDAAVSGHDQSMFSTGRAAADVDWSHGDDLDFNDFASSKFSQAQSLTGFGEGVDHRHNGSNSSNFQMAGYHSNSASIRSHESKGYPGIMFDSGSMYSSRASDASRTSLASIKSGRTGPLSAVAKASMKALKKVGSCWRCKFLRNKCDPQSPCALCPKGGKSNWEVVGCKRGNFGDLVPLKDLCLYDFDTTPVLSSGLSVDSMIDSNNQRRDTFLANAPGAKNVINNASASEILHEDHTGQFHPGPSKPLDHCVSAILFEISQTADSLLLLSHDGISLPKLLFSAASYQTKQENDQLIAQSLICLRSCLEVVRIKFSGMKLQSAHAECYDLGLGTICRANYARSLHVYLNLYSDELSRVMFKKENLRNKRSWWLSVFYSLCLQAMVKKALVSLCDEDEYGIPNSVVHYLQDPVQLFIASSGSLDPLPCASNSQSQTSSTHGTERNSGDGPVPSQSDYTSAKEAVVQTKWQVNGIHNWAQYLRHIFGIEVTGVADGDDGNSDAAMNDNIHSTYDEDSDSTSRLSDSLGRTTASKSKSSLAYYVSKIPHSADKKYKCTVCDKRFTRPSSLQTHMYSHTGEKPFECEFEGCERRFSLLSNLRRHRKIHRTQSDIAQ